MTYIRVLCAALIFIGASAQSCDKETDVNCSADNKKIFDQNTDWNQATSIYDFHANDIYGKVIQLAKYKGRIAIIINVASNCGLTDKNYKELQALYEKYESKGLSILAFPSNEFGGQEPGSSEDILKFVKGPPYNVTFDMFEKIMVNGDKAHPLYKWLKSQAPGFLTDGIKWNFSKFVIDGEGKVVERFAPTTSPFDMEDTLKKYLKI